MKRKRVSCGRRSLLFLLTLSPFSIVSLFFLSFLSFPFLPFLSFPFLSFLSFLCFLYFTFLSFTSFSLVSSFLSLLNTSTFFAGSSISQELGIPERECRKKAEMLLQSFHQNLMKDSREGTLP